MMYIKLWIIILTSLFTSWKFPAYQNSRRRIRILRDNGGHHCLRANGFEISKSNENSENSNKIR